MIRLAIVENDEDERYFMVDAFRLSGHFEIVGEFWNGDQLLDWLRANPVNLPHSIVTDLNMPGKNGYEVITEVKSVHPDIRVIATSTSSIQATRHKCIDLGAYEFLPKPDVFIDYSGYVNHVYDLLKGERH